MILSEKINIPKKAGEIVNDHIKMINSALPDFLDGYYICGSIALGAFDYGKSDIDFIAAVTRNAGEADINILKKIHNDMSKKYRQTVLDGFYILKDDLDSSYKSEVPCVRFNDGMLKGFTAFDKNSPDAFILKEHGITVKGLEARNLKYSVDFDILINKMKNNLTYYWVNLLNSCKKFPSRGYIISLFSPSAVEWGVLGVSRLYYTFKQRDITSKVGAGEYELKTADPKWHKIIKESMRLRNGEKSYYNSVFKRRSDAVGYMDYIIKECYGLFDKK